MKQLYPSCKKAIQLIAFLFFLFAFVTTNAQVGIGTNTPDASAKLDVTSTNKGVLLPRMALTGTADVSTIASPATALLVYNTATAGTSPNNVIPGYYYYSGTSWVNILTSASAITGVPYTGATGAVNLGNYDLTVNGLTIGLGHGSVVGNTVLGTYSLPRNTTASNNTAIGYGTLNSNTSGYNNTALGSQTLQGNSTGNNNTGIGEEAIQANTTGNNNTATGFQPLFLNASGNSNTAMGYNSLWKNSAGNFNTGIGQNALYQNTGSNNTGIGVNVLQGNSTGSNNIGLGYNAGVVDMNNLNTSVFDNSVFLGANSKMHADGETNQIVIGYNAIGNGSNTIQLGNTSITDVKTSGTVSVGGTALTSDKRLKTNIIPLNEGLTTIMRLNPVHYNKKISLEAKEYTKTENGFIAQELQKILPFIVKEGTDKDKLLSVDYNSIIPILTKGMQEQQTQIAAQQKQIDELKALVEKLLKDKK